MALFNAAAAIYVAGKAENLADALDLARRSVASGAAQSKLEHLREVSQMESEGDGD